MLAFFHSSSRQYQGRQSTARTCLVLLSSTMPCKLYDHLFCQTTALKLQQYQRRSLLWTGIRHQWKDHLAILSINLHQLFHYHLTIKQPLWAINNRPFGTSFCSHIWRRAVQVLQMNIARAQKAGNEQLERSAGSWRDPAVQTPTHVRWNTSYWWLNWWWLICITMNPGW